MVAIIINEFLKVTVKSSGAELISIKNTFTNKEYLWQGNPEYWARRAPVLFPIVGKLNGNKYRVEGKEYELPQHGFARDMIFELVDKNDTALTYSLKSNEQTLKIYPFLFEFIVKYTLQKNKILISYQVINNDQKPIQFSIGAHPAFYCPLEKEESISDYYFEFDKKESCNRTILSNGLTTKSEEPFLKNENSFQLIETIFDEDAIILKNLNSTKVTLKSKKSQHKITLHFAGFPYLAFWSKKGPAPFICIEPWYGIADNVDFAGQLSEKEGIQHLDIGKSFIAEYSLEISSPKN